MKSKFVVLLAFLSPLSVSGMTPVMLHTSNGGGMGPSVNFTFTNTYWTAGPRPSRPAPTHRPVSKGVPSHASHTSYAKMGPWERSEYDRIRERNERAEAEDNARIAREKEILRKEAERQAEIKQSHERLDPYVRQVKKEVRSIKRQLAEPRVSSQLDPKAVNYIQNKMSQARELSTVVAPSRIDLAELALRYTEAELRAIGQFLDGLQTGFVKGFYTTSDVIRAVYNNPEFLKEIPTLMMRSLTERPDLGHYVRNAYLYLKTASAYQVGHDLGHFASTTVQMMALTPGTPPVVGMALARVAGRIETSALEQALSRTFQEYMTSQPKKDIRRLAKHLGRWLEKAPGDGPYGRLTEPKRLHKGNVAYINGDRRIRFDIGQTPHVDRFGTHFHLEVWDPKAGKKGTGDWIDAIPEEHFFKMGGPK